MIVRKLLASHTNWNISAFLPALCTKSGINYIGSWTDADGEISTLHCCLDSPLLSAEDTYIMYTIPIFT